jgi:hypothetical protein
VGTGAAPWLRPKKRCQTPISVTVNPKTNIVFRRDVATIKYYSEGLLREVT